MNSPAAAATTEVIIHVYICDYHHHQPSAAALGNVYYLKSNRVCARSGATAMLAMAMEKNLEYFNPGQFDAD